MVRAGREFWVAGVVLALSLFFLIYLLLTTDWTASVALSPTSMPIFVISLVVLFSAGQLIASLAQARSRPVVDTPSEPSELAPARGLALFAWTVLYLIALPWLGYLVTTVAYTGGLAGLFGNRRPRSVILLMILVPASLLLFFERYLRIWLPAGRLFQ